MTKTIVGSFRFWDLAPILDKKNIEYKVGENIPTGGEEILRETDRATAEYGQYAGVLLPIECSCTAEELREIYLSVLNSPEEPEDMDPREKAFLEARDAEYRKEQGLPPRS